MKPLFVLLISFVASLMLLKFISGKLEYAKAARIAMAIMLVFTAVGHFVFTEGMTAIIPNFLPFKKQLVYATGVLEVLLGVALLLPKYSNSIGWILILFFIILLPANIKASIEQINYQTGELNGHGLSYLWFRIPLQVFFIVWIYFSAIKN